MSKFKEAITKALKNLTKSSGQSPASILASYNLEELEKSWTTDLKEALYANKEAKKYEEKYNKIITHVVEKWFERAKEHFEGELYEDPETGVVPNTYEYASHAESYFDKHKDDIYDDLVDVISIYNYENNIDEVYNYENEKIVLNQEATSANKQ